MGVAMLAVMLYHAWDLDLGLGALNDWRRLGFGGVDVFVTLSGMGLAISLASREREYGEFMARRAKRILPAYFAVMLPYTLCLLIVGRAELSTFIWNSTLLNYWVRCPGSFNWYVSGIMLLYLLTPPAVRLLRRCRYRVLALLAVTAAAFAASQALMHDDWWYHLDILYRVPGFAVGIVLGLWIAEDRRFTFWDGLVWAALLIAGAVYRHLRVGHSYAQLAYMFTLTTVPACLALAWLFDRLPLGFARRALAFVGENSLEIYLLNVSFFSERDFLRRFFDPGPGHYIYYIVSFALNILLGWGLHKTIERLRRLTPGVIQ